MPRAVWKGSLRFSLVSVPVEVYTAAESEDGEIHLNQLHAECNSRIRYKKTCPIHGEVANNEIVTGYEYEKDKYVIVDRDEVEKVQTKGGHSITIRTFIPPDDIDPMYYDGKTYFLAPGNGGGEKPYAVLCQAMTKMRRWAVGSVVLHGREQPVLVRPVDNVLTMTMLHYKSQIRSPSIIGDELPDEKTNPQEVKLAQQLIEASTDENFDFGEFKDHYTDQLKEIIDAKIAGKEIVVPETSEPEVPVINLMDALKKSMQKTKKAPKPSATRERVQQRQRRRKTS